MKQEKEPAAIRELRRIRQAMLAEEKRVGSNKFWTEVNRQGKEFAHRYGLNYVDSLSMMVALRNKPARTRKVHG